MDNLADPKGNITQKVRDLRSRVKQKIYADSSKYDYIYEPKGGRLHTQRDAKGQSTRYRYDQDDRLLGLDYFNAQKETPNVSFSYDPVLGRLTPYGK